MTSVLNSIFAKRAMLVFNSFVSAPSHSANGLHNQTPSVTQSPSPPDPIPFHFYTATIATCILFPWALINDSSSIINILPVEDRFYSLQLLFLSISLHYIQNLSSIYLLSHVTVLSYQVGQSSKRFFVIVSAVIYFQTPVTKLNLIGMGLACLGFLAYSLSKMKSNSSVKSHMQTSKFANSLV
jgi:drug/metabolite transporter (DMT)-like permease